MPKKSFKDNPALQFISEADQDIVPSTAPMQTATPVKPHTRCVETRSKRLNLLIQPSLHTRLKGIAAAQDVSINELIHKVLAEYADGEERK